MIQDSKQLVAQICQGVYVEYTQVVIDIVETIQTETLIDPDVSGDDVLSVCYLISTLLDIFNPKFEMDIALLQELEVALAAWHKDIERANAIANIARQN